ncbi:MAG: cation:proton antiporter [Candidatus Pacebacteria bacterium]|nr:cation:proton antiporter [Candidatus Paceibacterota bacterium]
MIEFFQGFKNLIEFTPQVELAVLLFFVSILGILFRALKQPLVLAYLVAGILISAFGIFNIEDGKAVEVFSSMGIMFLLFLVGMEMDYRSIKKIGKLSLIIGTGQVIFTTVGAFLIGYFIFGFDFLSSIYIGIALAFSSTVIIIKILSDKGSLSTLHGRAAIGLLLVQDIIVIFILIALNTVEAGGVINAFYFIKTMLLAVFFFGGMLFLGRSVFPYIFHKIARSQELLFLTSLAWLFVFAAVIEQFGFSLEIAGFLGGIALANSSEKYHIASKVRPLRDFFIVIFFVYMGSLMTISHFDEIMIPMIVFSVFVLVGNPLIVMMLMGLMRYKKRTGFLTGVTVAQISEFSLIFVALGLSLGHIPEEVFALVVSVGVLTIGVSTYSIVYSEKIFPYLSPFLSFFERKKTYEEEGDFGISKEVVLVGAQRIGKRIINYIHKDNLLVIDFDPSTIDYLKKKDFNHIFGDIKDPHLFEEVNLEKTKLVISTSPQVEDNLFLVKKIKEINNKIKVVVRSQNKEDALLLYETGADYVFLPHFLSGEYLGKIIDKELKLKDLGIQKKKDIKLLKKIC